MTAPFAPGLTDGSDEYRHAVDLLIRDARADAHRRTLDAAADTIHATARRLCCGEDPSTDHSARAEHSRTMTLAGELAAAVRRLS